MSVSNENITILVADDVFTNIEFLRYILRKEKYNILPVNNGVEALDAVEKNSVDLILLDVMMPEMDGFEVCKRLKENDDQKDIPVIFLTARTDVESTVKGFELGAVDYVTKPFHRQELLARVKNHIELQKSKAKYNDASDNFQKLSELAKKQAREILDESQQASPNVERIADLAREIIKS